jgi:hypothetical protein
LPEEVEGDFGLWEQSVPKSIRERIGDTSKHAEEVCFKVTNGHFGSVAVMTTGWDELDREMVLVSDVIFHVA